MLTACVSQQSALHPAGWEAERVDILFWVMVAGGAVIFVGVIGLLLYATRHHTRRKVHSEQAAGRLIVGGTLFTIATLALLLGYSLWLMQDLRPWTLKEGESRLEVEVTGEQFWWRVVYREGEGTPRVITANEVRLPVGERVNFILNSADMIHSFWIPSLGGKMDMIPGRTTQLSLLATKPGTFRAPCAEYCGTSHALMAFSAVAMEPADFEAWLDARAAPSPAAQGDGHDAFMRQGCGACHSIQGTQAAGTIGPDLSHVGSRVSLAAGILPNDEESLTRFIRNAEAVKPGARMPAYDMLADDELAAIARYLKGLE